MDKIVHNGRNEVLCDKIRIKPSRKRTMVRRVVSYVRNPIVYKSRRNPHIAGFYRNLIVTSTIYTYELHPKAIGCSVHFYTFRKLGLFYLFVRYYLTFYFDINIFVQRHTCSRRYKLTDNNIFLDTDKRVNLTLDSSICENLCCLLE